MSTSLNTLCKVGAVAIATAVIAGCQDAAAPLTSPDTTLSSVRELSVHSNSARHLIADQYIVVLRNETIDVDAQAKALVGKAKGKLKNTYKKGLKGFAATLTASEAANVSRDPSVAYVEQDQIVTVGVGKPTKTTPKGSNKKGNLSNDPSAIAGPGTEMNAPWGLDRIDQSALPLNTSYAYDRTGAGVHVYIIDSGIRTTHVEFGGRATADFTTIDDGYGATGCNWHGTHVAGIVGGVTVGVAKAVSLHSVRVLDCNASGSLSDLIAGIDWVVANHVSPSVANISIEAGYSDALNTAVDRAISAGITVVVAAGNDSADACGYSPGSAANAITVGATTSLDEAASFSNVGSCVDLMAPGVQISSAMNWDDTSLEWGSGTSMAAPHVAGASALYLEANPLATPSLVAQSLLLNATAGVIRGLTSSTSNLLLKTK